jgi:hypothetical protein
MNGINITDVRVVGNCSRHGKQMKNIKELLEWVEENVWNESYTDNTKEKLIKKLEGVEIN